MLTKELAVFEFDGGRIKPDCLKRPQHRHYVDYAEQMLHIYREGIGKTRQELHSAVRQVFVNEPDCRPQRVEAFCKLLDEERVSKYDTDRSGKAAKLRCKVFRLASSYHPLVEHEDRLFEHSESKVKQIIARELGHSSWADIEDGLFADVFEYNRLKSFAGYASPEALLSRYNVAQVQAALFNATRHVIRARSDFQRIVSHVKLAGLLHDIKPSHDNVACKEYIIRLDGPASVLRETRRYGVNMAKFLPSLLSCRDWQMDAELVLPFARFRRRFHLVLSSDSGLKSEVLPPEEFDSTIEERLAKKWGQEKRNGWSMKRAGAILQRNQTAFVPDFAFEHEDGRRAFLEIIGFWTPEYLQAKFEKLELFKGEQIILAIAKGATAKLENIPQDAILFKTALKLNDVLTALDRLVCAEE